jgi:hypothetical protein
MDAAFPRYHTTIGAASLVVGPALMSAGDLIHPAETWVAATQVAIVAQASTRWYAAHLLLFIGMLLLVPGILAITRLARDRKVKASYVARLLMLAGAGTLLAVFVGEMMLGRFVSRASDQAVGVVFLDTFMSPAIFGALGPGLIAFFVGTGILVKLLSSPADPFRWPALLFGLGALLILGEIISAQVLLSQIGNVVIFIAGVGFARQLVRMRGMPR